MMFLFLIALIQTNSAVWIPKPGTTWEWQLGDSDKLDMAYNETMYDVDLFDTSQADIDKLHKLGRIVICYIDVGTWEDWRPDANEFPNSVKGNNVDGWAGEKWLDIRQWDIRTNYGTTNGFSS
eukprot:868622_1